MKQYIGKFVVAAAMVLAVSGIARAHDDDDDAKPCRLSTLDGLYVFTASGFNIVTVVGVQVAQPKAIVELIDFHGDGKLTVPAATVSINGAISRSTPGGTGTYTVDADCTGSLVFGPPLAPAGPAYDLFVAFKGSQIQMIQTGPGSPVFQGTAERVSR
jgi:hypothetical protein